MLYQLYPVKIYLFEVDNRNTRERCETCSKLIVKTPETYFTLFTSVSIVGFEKVNVGWVSGKLAELRSKFSCLEFDLVGSRNVNETLAKQLSKVERNAWQNEEFSRKICLEISGIPDSVKLHQLEETVCNVFSETGAPINARNIESCYFVKWRGPGRKQLLNSCEENTFLECWIEKRN